MADKTDMDNSRGWYWPHLPQMGGARGLMEALDRIRNIDRGIRPPSPPPVGIGRARARALLLEVVSCGRAPHPVSYPRGRCLGSLSPPNPGRGIIISSFPTPPPVAPGLGRARVEPLALIPPYAAQILCPNVWTPKELPWRSPLTNPSSPILTSPH